MRDKTKWNVLAPLMVLVLLGCCVTIAAMNDVKATTWIEGHITEDTTWALANSPYLVTGDILVDEGVTLTIERGVTVKFGGYIGIFVNGSLYAVGSNTDKISFTSNKPSPEVGDWNMIKFQGTKNETFVMKNVAIEYGTCGVAISSIGASIIENCEFYNNTKGIHIIGNSNAKIRSNTFKFNQIGIEGDGISISDIHLANNIITENKKTKSPLDAHGIHLCAYERYKNPSIYNITINNNTIYSNGGSGIFFGRYNKDDPLPDHINNITMNNNTIYSNGYSGIFLRTDCDIHNITMNNNTIYSNGYSGISLYAGYDFFVTHSRNIYDVTFNNNTIYSNGHHGIYLSSSVPSSSSYSGNIYNVIFNNNTLSSNLKHGVKLSTSHHVYGITMNNNAISSNSDSGIYLSGIWGSSRFSPRHYISNVTIAGNVLALNTGSGIEMQSYSQRDRYSDVGFGIIMHNNYVHSTRPTSGGVANGIYIAGGSKTLITNSTIHNNTIGVLYSTTTDNFASFNNIYQNEYGMNVTNGATVKAEQNYWGDPSGPCHVSMNPEGKGNPVNGNGVDLDMIPFLTSPMEFGLSIASDVNSYSCIMI